MYEPYLCNGCHDLMQNAMNCNNVLLLLMITSYVEHTEVLGSKQNLLSNSIKAKHLLRFVKLP